MIFEVAINHFSIQSEFAKEIQSFNLDFLKGPSASKTAGASAPTDWVTYAVAFASAVLGGVLTLAGELFFRVRDEKSTFRDGKTQLIVELRTIFRECERRASLASGVFPAVALEAPLPRSAWTTLLLSGQLRRLKASQVESLNTFYRDVDSANARASLVPMLLQTVALSQQAEVRASFTEEAHRVSTAPYGELKDRRAELEEVLGEALKLCRPMMCRGGGELIAKP